MKKFNFKIILPATLSILLFILTIFLIIIPRYQQSIMNGKREMIKELTNSVWSFLLKYENDEREGLLTREEAQKIALTRIQYLRYGEENKDYFWITDMTPKMIMHPFREDLNGKDLTSFTDAHGKKLFVEFVTTVKKLEHGYVDYMWQWKDDSLHIVPKLSYVRIFKPWNWVVGTGIYIEDVKKEISALTKKMVWISVGISLTIALLLLYLLKQSLNIERKRVQVENELHESKEKFRTLVEAATEGLIMVNDGKISFSNNVISKMTGYESADLVNLSLNEIISNNNNKDLVDSFSKNIIKEGQFELNLMKKNGGFVEVLATSTVAGFYGKTVNIIIVKDLSIDRNLNPSNLEYQKLINTLNFGFFKVRIDAKGKFIYANETAIRILGFDNFEELSEVNIFRLFADAADRKNLRKSLMADGYIKNKALKIYNRNKDCSIVAVSLVLFSIENSDYLICDGIIEDITSAENDKKETNNVIASLKANDFVLAQPVKVHLNAINTLDADATIGDVTHLLWKRKTDSLFLAKNKKEYLGIITNADIQKRVISLNLKLDNPAYLIMSSPVISVSENTSVLDAIRICEENKINHLAVKNESGEITGLVKHGDIYKALINSLSFYLSDIKKAQTTDALLQCYNNFMKILKPLIHCRMPVGYISTISTGFSDAVIRRSIELAIEEIGQPPVNFSFICVGSEGRKEETLFTDQDNAIIYEDVAKDKENDVNGYFIKLGEIVCNSLNYTGYSFCSGNIMAKNPQWCKPIGAWERNFDKWISAPEPQNLLDATIFFDYRIVYGDDTITEKLRETIEISIINNPLFLYHLAFNTYNTRNQHLSSGKILSDRNADIIDLKGAMVTITMFARTYALQNHIRCSNTIERLMALKERKIINENTVDEIVFAYNFLMSLRFRTQADLSDNKIPLSNLLNIRKLNDMEIHLLKKVLSAVPEYQNKIKTDFRIAT